MKVSKSIDIIKNIEQVLKNIFMILLIHFV